MPKYVYACSEIECARTWEVSHGINDVPPTTCPQCGQETLKRIPVMTEDISIPEDDFSMCRPKERRVGALTDEYINTVKKEIEDLKHELGNRLFDPTKRNK